MEKKETVFDLSKLKVRQIDFDGPEVKARIEAMKKQQEEIIRQSKVDWSILDLRITI